MKMIFKYFILFSLINNAIADEIVFRVNPTTIRTQLFSKNITLLQALNNVQNSKLNVNMARAKLLPSLNLGVLLPALANPTFLLSSVTFLFPFLVPSNWAVLKQEKLLFESDKSSYKALQLNVLSNALSLYYTYLNDLEVKQIFVDQSEIISRLYLNLKKQSDVLGNITTEELSLASAQWEDAKIKVSKLEELLIAEKAAVRTILGLPLGADLILETTELIPSEFENKSLAEVIIRSHDSSPEFVQLEYLVKAAKAGKFAKFFGFLTNASVVGSSTISNSSPFDSLKTAGGFSFGVDNLVNLKIADNNAAAIKLRQDQLQEENERVAETIVGQLSEIKLQQKESLKLLEDRLRILESQQRQFALGLMPLQNLLLSQSQLTDSRVNHLKNQMDLNLQRLTLLRLVVDGDFSEVKGCNAAEQHATRGIFHRNKEQSLDEICK